MTHAVRAFGVVAVELSQSLTKPQSVRRTDGECADAALGAAGATEQMRTTAAGGVGKGAIHESNEGAILCQEARLLCLVGHGDIVTTNSGRLRLPLRLERAGDFVGVL